MRKILIGLVLLTIFAAPLAPLAALAVAGTPQESCTLKRNITVSDIPYPKGLNVTGDNTKSVCGLTPSGTGPCYTADWGMVCILNTLNSIIDWTFTILVIMAVFFTILGAATIIFAGGKAENVDKGKNFILYAAIGLVVAFLARALPGIVRSIGGF